MDREISEALMEVERVIRGKIEAELPTSEISLKVGGIEITLDVAPRAETVTLRVRRWNQATATKRGANVVCKLSDLPDVPAGEECPEFMLRDFDKDKASLGK